MTSPDNSGNRDDSAESDAERTTVFSSKDVLGSGGDAGEPDTMTPPPWQRVNVQSSTEWPGSGATTGSAGDPAGGVTAQDSAQSEEMLYSGHGADVNWSSAQTVQSEQPVVSGTAAARLLGQDSNEGAADPGSGGAAARTAVDVGSAGRSGDKSKGGGTPSALRRPGRGPRRANLQIKRFDPWSVLKLSLVLGVALLFVWLVAVGVLYIVLEGMGVWDKLNGTYSQLVQDGSGAASEALITPGTVFGVTAVVGVVNIVLLAALATVMSFVYNVSADLAGGLEVTLSERE